MAGWYDAIKDAVSFAEKLRDTELNVRLADVRMEGAKLAEENARLREELVSLREQVNRRAAVDYRHNAYWQKTEGEKHEGPFCPKCFDGDGKLCRMSERDEYRYWRCPVCGTTVQRPGPTIRAVDGPSSWMS